MIGRRRLTVASCFVLLLAVATAGCSRQSPLPTAVAPPDGDASAVVALAVPEDAPPAGAPAPATEDWLSRHGVLGEAFGALRAIYTGEQVHLQKWGTYRDAADNDELRAALGLNLDEPGRRWAFSVRDASALGFTAEARGRDGTRAARWVVRLDYVRLQPLVWTVERTRGR